MEFILCRAPRPLRCRQSSGPSLLLVMGPLDLQGGRLVWVTPKYVRGLEPSPLTKYVPAASPVGNTDRAGKGPIRREPAEATAVPAIQSGSPQLNRIITGHRVRNQLHSK